MADYSKTLKYAKSIKKNVEKDYELGESPNWVYYFAKQIIEPKTNVKQMPIKSASKPSGDHLSRQIYKSSYLDLAKRLIAYVEKNKQLPNSLKFITKTNKIYNIRLRDLVYMFARILVFYDENKQLPKYANINSKCWIKPSEPSNDVFAYFVKVFGDIDCIDDALEKISCRVYGYYYDDVYSNKQSIDRMKNRQGVNCTDSMQVFYNIMLEFIKRGKYKKVECLHVKCSGGDGHVRMRITLNDGSTILRDPASVLDCNGVTSNWCTSGYTLLAIDPYWFKQNLNR